jgi:aminopeptidase N
MHTSRGRLAGVALAVTALVGLQAGSALATVGGPGGGDPYFPRQGNGGYDVTHYGLALRYDTVGRRLTGVATIRATATGSLTRFDLDLRRAMTVSSVRVDGHRARFGQPARLRQELRVHPARRLTAGKAFTVVVRYAGRPRAITDPDGSLEGWVTTKDGAFVVGEPQGSPSWFPCNDDPRDKATYDFRVTVPPTVTAIANGELRSTTTRRSGWHTFRWHSGAPMATYLATVTTGVFDVRTGLTRGGIPYYIASDPSVSARSRAVLRKVPAMTDYFVKLFGPYPFGSTGAVVDHAPKVGYALETQTKPLYDSPPDELTAAHETAHMWFGDSVTLSRWSDIWVNEGFAEFASWMWSEHSGGKSAQALFDHLYAKKASNGDVWRPPPGHPGGPKTLFADSVYARGAMTLQALRVKLGDGVFFPMLQAWYAGHVHGNVTVAGFTSFASSYSGVDLSSFFHTWLYAKAKPTSW